MNFARIFASTTLVSLPKKRPSFACTFTKMSPCEELGTLDDRDKYNANYDDTLISLTSKRVHIGHCKQYQIC